MKTKMKQNLCNKLVPNMQQKSSKCNLEYLI